MASVYGSSGVISSKTTPVQEASGEMLLIMSVLGDRETRKNVRHELDRRVLGSRHEGAGLPRIA